MMVKLSFRSTMVEKLLIYRICGMAYLHTHEYSVEVTKFFSFFRQINVLLKNVTLEMI